MKTCLSPKRQSMSTANCKTTPSKSIPENISGETQAIIERRTGKRYIDPKDLPSELDLSHCKDLVDVSDLGGVQKLNLR